MPLLEGVGCFICFGGVEARSARGLENCMGLASNFAQTSSSDLEEGWRRPTAHGGRSCTAHEQVTRTRLSRDGTTFRDGHTTDTPSNL